MAKQAFFDKSPERLDLAKRVTAWREHAGLRKIELARALAVEPSVVTKWEKAETAPGPENHYRIAEACGVTMEEFWGALPDVDDERTVA